MNRSPTAKSTQSSKMLSSKIQDYKPSFNSSIGPITNKQKLDPITWGNSATFSKPNARSNSLVTTIGISKIIEPPLTPKSTDDYSNSSLINRSRKNFRILKIYPTLHKSETLDSSDSKSNTTSNASSSLCSPTSNNRRSFNLDCFKVRKTQSCESDLSDSEDSDSLDDQTSRGDLEILKINSCPVVGLQAKTFKSVTCITSPDDQEDYKVEGSFFNSSKKTKKITNNGTSINLKLNLLTSTHKRKRALSERFLQQGQRNLNAPKKLSRFCPRENLACQSPWRHLIFSPKVNSEVLKNHLLLVHSGLEYATKYLQEPSEKYLNLKQISLAEEIGQSTNLFHISTYYNN